MATAPEHHDNLVKVFDTEQETEALVVKGLLETAGIDSVLLSLDANQDILPIGGVILEVREEQADEARRIIDDYRNNPATEEELTGEPSQPE